MATLLACKDKSPAGWLWGGGAALPPRSQGCDHARRPRLSFPSGCPVGESPSFPGAQMGWIVSCPPPPPRLGSCARAAGRRQRP